MATVTFSSTSLAIRNAQDFLERITYKDNYKFFVGSDLHGLFIQLKVWRPDTFTGEYDWGLSGKSYFDVDTTDSQFARATFGLAKAYEEHECREAFAIDGVRIFGPHIHLNALIESGKRLEHLEDV